MIFNIKAFLIGLLTLAGLVLISFIYEKVQEKFDCNLFYIIISIFLLIYFCFLLGNLVIILFWL